MGAVREVVRHYEHGHSIRFAWAWDHLGVNSGAEEARSEVPPAVAQAVAAIVAAAAAAGAANAAATAWPGVAAAAAAAQPGHAVQHAPFQCLLHFAHLSEVF